MPTLSPELSFGAARSRTNRSLLPFTASDLWFDVGRIHPNHFLQIRDVGLREVNRAFPPRENHLKIVPRQFRERLLHRRDRAIGILKHRSMIRAKREIVLVMPPL